MSIPRRGGEAKPETRNAGDRILEWVQTPIGEEIVEGTIGGLMAGLPSFFVQDQDKGQAAIMTAGAVLGGIGVGMAGRRLGAMLGEHIHPMALEDQNSAWAGLARTMGSETTFEGLEQQGRMMRGQVADYLVDKQAVKMIANNEIDPDLLEELKTIRQVSSAVDSYQSASPAQRASMKADILNNAGFTPEKLEKLSMLEEKLTRGAVDEMDQTLREVADMVEMSDRKIPILTPELVRGMSQKPDDVTGEHVGRMIGRVAGDEIGILGGLGLGSVLASQLGAQSPKDLEIARLKEQLQQGG